MKKLYRYFDNKNILITGGGGFIGTNLARRLVSNYNCNVTVADIRFIDWYLEDIDRKLEKIRVDIRDYWRCLKLTRRKDIVFHLSANMGGIGFIVTNRANVMRDNLRMNINMLEASKENNVERFFFSSSACVYPEEKQTTPDVLPLREEDAIPANPDTYYGWEKLTTEKLCEAYYLDYELETRVARFHNIYGEYCSFDERGKAPAHLIGKALLYPRVRFTIWGDGRQTRSFCYIEDCLDAVLLLTSSDIREPLNIGSDRLVTIDELANMIIKISGKYIEKEYIETGIQGVRGRNADLTKIRQLLGWYPKYSLEEGLERTFTWALKNINRIDWSYLLRSVS